MERYKFASQIFPVGDAGEFVLFTTQADRSFDDRQFRLDRYASAFLLRLGSKTKVEVLQSLTAPRPPSEIEAARHLNLSASQEVELEALSPNAPLSRKIAKNIARFQVAARFAQEAGRYLPRYLHIAEDGRAMKWMREEATLPANSLPPLSLSIVDLRNGDVSQVVDVEHGAQDFSLASLKRIFAANGELDRILTLEWRTGLSPPRDETNANARLLEEIGLNLQKETDPRARREAERLHAHAIAEVPRHDRARNVVVERSLTDGLRETRVFDQIRQWPELAFLESLSNWVTLDIIDDKHMLCIFSIAGTVPAFSFELQSGPLGEGAISFAAAARAPFVAVGYNGGLVEVIDYSCGKRREFRPHGNLRSEEPIQLSLSPSGHQMASVARSELVSTAVSLGLSVGRSVRLAPVSRHVHAYKWQAILDFEPAVAFVGETLVLGTGDEFRQIKMPSDDVESGTFVSELGRKDSKRPLKLNRKLSLPEQLRSAGLARVSDPLMALHSPALLIKTKKLGAKAWNDNGTGELVPLGTSRVGGWPDMLCGSTWPLWQGRPMMFVAQINLAEANQEDANLKLPSTGLLAFFLASSDHIFTHDEDTGHRCFWLENPLSGIGPGSPTEIEASMLKVIYLPDTESLERVVWQQAPFPGPIEPKRLSFKKSRFSWPDEYAPAISQLQLNADEMDAYVEFSRATRGARSEVEFSQLMGHAYEGPLRPEMELALATLNLEAEYDQPTPPEVFATAARFRPFLRLDSDAIDMKLGEGSFSLFGEPEAMENGDFSSVVLYREY